MPGLYEAHCHSVLSSSFLLSTGTEVQTGLGNTAAEGLGWVSQFFQLVPRPVSLPVSLELLAEEHGKCLCTYMNHSLSLSLKPSSPSYLAAVQNESASSTPAPGATFPVTETNVTLDRDIKTHLD